MMNIHTIVVISGYVLGIIGWFGLWYVLAFIQALLKNKLLFFPLLLVPVIFILEIIFVVLSPAVEKFHTEELLITVVERNNSQLITATFGIIVLAATLLNFKTIGRIGRSFLLFVTLSLVCSVAGVLVLYWLPTNLEMGYFSLRHLKTIPYTYSIGFFLSALLVLLKEISEVKEFKRK